MSQLTEYIKEQIWILEYPVRFAGMDLYGRMTIIRLANGDVFIHDPCQIDDSIQEEINKLGEVKYIIAPGYYHHLFVTDFQQRYPHAETFICPGLEKKRPDIRFNSKLGDEADPGWKNELDQVYVHALIYSSYTGSDQLN